MYPFHLGQLHPFEQVIVLLIAFGPFIIAAVVALILRRREQG